MSGAAAGGVAAAAAAKRKREMEEEEEKLTAYNGNDLEGWEFKILRSNTGAFKKREVVDKVRQEEARAGWEMVEKFDDNRIRFKRPIERRANDRHLAIDPYRTTYGMGQGTQVAIVLIITALIAGGAILAALMFKG